MHSLENAREKIDRADREMARLFQERMRAVNEIARYKAENGLPVFDPEREAQVIKKNAALIEDKDMDTGITCVETFDYEVVDKIYRPFDNLMLSDDLNNE